MNTDTESKIIDDVIGVVPAAGQARRIAPLSCSKEIYPIGFLSPDANNKTKPRAVCHYLLDKMRVAGIRKVYIILREGKWDIMSYLKDGSMFDMHIAYLMMGLPFGVPYTLDQAYPFVKKNLVALGFPDVIFESYNAFGDLLKRQKASKSDVVLGLFPADCPGNADMVDLNDCGRVKAISVKPQETHLHYAWGIAIWAPAFTDFIHDYLSKFKKRAKIQSELYVGNIIQAAIREGLRVEGVHISDKPFLDIGTPKNLIRALKRFGGRTK